MIENAALISVSRQVRPVAPNCIPVGPQKFGREGSKFASANDVILGRPLGLPLTGANRKDGNVLLRFCFFMLTKQRILSLHGS